MINAWECFHFAALELVRSTPIKQRLVTAYRRHLANIPVEQLPGEIRDNLNMVLRTLVGVQPLRGEDAVAASVRKMSTQDADECAALILELFGQMCRVQLTMGRQNGTLVKLHSVESGDADFDMPAVIAAN